jgi:hypothetical protein
VQVLVVADWRRLASHFGPAQTFLIAVPAHLVLSLYAERPWNLGETGPLSQGVQAGREALRIRDTNGMVVRKKRPRGFN